MAGFQVTTEGGLTEDLGGLTENLGYEWATTGILHRSGML